MTMSRIKLLLSLLFWWCAYWLGCSHAQQLRNTAAGRMTTTTSKTNHHRQSDDKTQRDRDLLGETIEANGDTAPPPKQAPAAVSGDRRTIDNLIMNFQIAKARLLDRLQVDYGTAYFDDLFMDHQPKYPLPNNETTSCTVGRSAFLKGSDTSLKSWARTVRKMKINLLQYVIEGRVQDFVWATAGNDGAAGHGNFFDEQYTMVLQNRARDLFQAVGLDLVARPFGMGGTTSAPEIAGCAEEVYGTDVDLITWDFGMTDGKNHWRMEFFAHRVMILPNHPTLLVLNAGIEDARRELVDHLTEQGMAIMREDGHFMVTKCLSFPDSRYRSQDELDDMPEHVAHFRCGYNIENGFGCMEYKYRHNGTCDERSHQTNWHKGWKWHAYYGNTYALFLLEVLEDALYELKAEQGDNVAIFKRLEAEEDAEYRVFEEKADIKYEIQWSIDDLTAMQLYRDPTYCHTARMPAQTRYLGHVLNQERYDDWFKYKKGGTFKSLQQNPQPEIRLAYQPLDREKKKLCNLTLSIDTREFFLANDRFDGWQKIVVPNNAEQNAYDYHQSSGIIAICAAACSFECAGNPLLSVDHIETNKASMKVNGEPVGSVEEFDNCFLLRTELGQLQWSPNIEKKYEIEVHVAGAGKHFEFTSIIIW